MRKTTIPCWFAVALGLTGPAGALDQRIEALTAGLESIQSGFRQQVVDETGRLVEESSGTFALCAPDLFRWHYETPYEQLIVADGERVWMYDVELEQVTVKDQDQAASSSPLYVLTRPESLEERYQVEYSKQDGQELILLRPRTPEAEFEWVEIAFVDETLDSLVIQDGFGQQTRIRLEDVVTNEPVAVDSFEFRPPPGMDVIGAEELLNEVPADPE